MFDWFFEGLLYIAAQHHPFCMEKGSDPSNPFHFCLPEWEF